MQRLLHPFREIDWGALRRDGHNIFTKLIRAKDPRDADTQEITVPGRQRLSRCLTTMDLTSLGVGSCVGTGMYLVAGMVARKFAGPGVVISFIIAAMASIFSGACYAEFGVRVPNTTGSAYMYSYVTVGEFIAFIIGWNMILEYLIGTSACARALSACFDSICDGAIENELANKVGTMYGKPPDFLAFTITLLMMFVLVAGVKKSLFFNNLLNAINVTVWVFIVTAGLFYIDISNWTEHNGFLPHGWSGVFSGAATCFYAFIGFDIIATTGEEAHDPKRSIPLAMFLSLGIILICYVTSSIVLTLVVPYDQVNTESALVQMFSHVNAPTCKYIVAIGALAGLTVSMFGSMFPMPRVVYAMALDGLIFKKLASISESTGTPAFATICGGVAAAVVALMVQLEVLVEMMSIDTVTNTVQSTVDTTKNVALAAADKSSSLFGAAKDTVANTVQSTVDTTKNVASSAADKSASLFGSAKDNVANTVQSTVDTTKNVASSVADKSASLFDAAKDTVTGTVESTVDSTKTVASSTADKGASLFDNVKGTLLAYTLVSTCVLVLRYQPHSTNLIELLPQSLRTPVEPEGTASTNRETTFAGQTQIMAASQRVMVRRVTRSSPDSDDTLPGDESEEYGRDDAFLVNANTENKFYGAVPGGSSGSSTACGRFCSAISRQLHAKSYLCPGLFPWVDCGPATDHSGMFVIKAVGVMYILIIVFDMFAAYGSPGTSTFTTVTMVILLLSIILILLLISRKPQNRSSLIYMTPGLPLVPTIAIIVNIYLILNLSILTLVRFTIWMILGLIMYFKYGIKNSTLETDPPVAAPPTPPMPNPLDRTTLPPPSPHQSRPVGDRNIFEGDGNNGFYGNMDTFSDSVLAWHESDLRPAQSPSRDAGQNTYMLVETRYNARTNSTTSHTMSRPPWAYPDSTYNWDD